MKDDTGTGPLRERLEEYADGLLAPAERTELEHELERDAGLRAELERARAFETLLVGLAEAGPAERDVDRILAALHRRRARRGRLVLLAAAAAAVLVLGLLLRPGGRTAPREDPELAPLKAEWREFGRRLGWMAAERRRGRVPRRGLGDLDVPPARASGIVFEAALGELGVALPPGSAERIRAEVSAHFVAVRALDRSVEGQRRHAEASLETYRRLRNLAGRAVADAFYDVFRPGLADLRTARRVGDGRLAAVLERLDPGRARAYLHEYHDAIAALDRFYGREKVRRVLARLAPDDRRTYRRDASQDGVGRDAVLSIRARLYEAAARAGAPLLYVDIG